MNYNAYKRGYIAQPLGIEPRPRGLEALVLPLHHSCIFIIAIIFTFNKLCVKIKPQFLHLGTIMPIYPKNSGFKPRIVGFRYERAYL